MKTVRAAGIASAVAMALSAGNASAASIESLMFPGQQNKFSDNSAEYLLNKEADGSYTTVDRAAILGGDLSSGQIDVGDRIRAIYTIETIEDLTGGGGSNSLSSAGVELTAIGDFEVASKTVIAPGIVSFTFKPFAGFASEIAGLANVASTGTTAADLTGAMFAFFEDSTPNFSRTGVSTAADEATATDGTFRGAIGFLNGLLNNPGEYFGTPGTGGSDNVGDALFVPDSTAISQTGFGLNFIVELFPTIDFGKVGSGCGPLGVQVDCNDGGFGGLVDVNGSGPTNGIATTNPDGSLGAPATQFDVFDDINFTARVVAVPEPGTVTLLGLGLMGVVGMSRRKRK